MNETNLRNAERSPVSYSVETNEVRFYSEYHPGTDVAVKHMRDWSRVGVSGNDYAAGMVTLSARPKRPTVAGVAFDLTPEAARKLAQMLIDQSEVAET